MHLSEGAARENCSYATMRAACEYGSDRRTLVRLTDH